MSIASMVGKTFKEVKEFTESDKAVVVTIEEVRRNG